LLSFATEVASSAVSLYDVPLKTLRGEPTSLADQKGKALLVVNVASQCGLTPQYTGLEALHERLKDRGFSVLGFPSNQFGAQEPGSAEEIEQFCSTNYGITFPMYEKADVNGDDRQPLYQELTKVADAEGHDGDIRWNFEKFLVSPDGEVVGRFSPMVTPEDPALVEAVEAQLPQ
jgi:glutathione peroxidase